MNLTRQSWPKGWNPSQDPVNGDPSALLRMDNLYLDETGVLSLVRGIQEVTSYVFSSYIDRIYSKQIGANESIWVGVGNPCTQILRSANGTFSDAISIASGPFGTRCVFGDGLGRVFVIAGAASYKDSGMATPQNLGLMTPATPTVTSISQPIQSYSGTWTVNVGTDNSHSSTGEYFFIDTTLSGVCTLALTGSPVDTINISGISPEDDPGDDLFSFTIIPDNSIYVTQIRVDIQMDSSDCYSYTWAAGNDQGGDPQNVLTPGLQEATTLSVQRSQFVRHGTNTALDWTKIVDIKFSLVSSLRMNCTFQAASFSGGVQGPLNGVYTYIQVNRNNTGQYVAVSPPSLPTNQQTLISGKVQLTPSTCEAQVTDVYFYRKSVTSNAVAGTSTALDQYYLVAQTTPTVAVYDTTTDVSALETNLTANMFLQTMEPSDPNYINDTIIGMEGIFNERMLYLSSQYLYLSDRLNPDAVDPRYTLKASGDQTEINLWVRKLTNNVLILGTSKNLYEITGTLLDLLDGTIDATIVPIGEAYPPLSYDNAFVNGSIFYMAADGIRATQGSNSQYVGVQLVAGGSTYSAQALRLLFQGQTRAGFPPFLISRYATDYQMTAGKTRIYFIIPAVGGTRWLVAYDTVEQTWRVQVTDPVAIFATPTDRVLVGYNNGSQAGLYQLDSGGGGFTDVSNTLQAAFNFKFTTVFDSNQQPRNRKDTFTLKLVLDTGGSNVTVQIQKDSNDPTSGWTTLSTTVNSNGMSTQYFDLSGVTLGFRYSVQITDTSGVTKFKLYELTIEYDPRPEQVNYLRIPNNNLGTICRKRFSNYAFVIDTLGNNITFTPYIDNSSSGIAPSTATINTNGKVTSRVDFTQEQLGVDIGGILSGGVFEFYGINPEEIVSERLPAPAKYLVIPANNYGTPNRKRHTSYKFQINTRSQNVTFTPVLDGVSYTPSTVNTNTKRTFEHFFTQGEGDVIGIDIGGLLNGGSNPFEFYGAITPQKVEQLPDQLEYYRIPNNNFGVAARKRIRALPMIIDTLGNNITFTPIIDGSAGTTSTFNTSGKRTVIHYFTIDVFGIDFGGILSGGLFEFYEFLQPESVEVLPVPKIYDQLGPMRFDKIGKVFGFRIRIILTGAGANDVNLPFGIYGDSNTVFPAESGTMYSGTIPLSYTTDQVAEVQFPKGINTCIFRLTLGPSSNPFHRFDAQIRVSASGMESDSQWIPIR